MRNLRFKLLCSRLLVGVLLITTVACGNKQSQLKVQSANRTWDTVIPTEIGINVGNTAWVPLKEVVTALGLHLKQTDDKINIGYSDVMFEVQLNKNSAKSYGQSISLSQGPIVQNGQVYMTAKSLSELLHTETKVDPWKRTLHIGPIRNDNGITNTNPSNERNFGMLGIAENRDELVSYAKKFLGVPYEFGAAPYEQSKTFDCSSFTQHVFKRFDTNLPRLAREQAKVGKSVERSQLQAGDLIFFTVKGRFESDKIPGHVGIYIGDGKFIHTWGDPGVQISPIDSGYWKDVVLSMRRIQ
ncbi:C40 family peptidase [Paenibacillus segetis]|uniref:NlpC/P60 domain-containing protein n=1 Tax=Paenibacillus segetis TaxID=1325360 RepID=A0ABQ1Y9L0_9BACL|nr:C40 family peptidase [Paenibacillus segetis]GGH16472.1 hypothetical protein GCM10008013_11260 [Paenibacillus segetis]